MSNVQVRGCCCGIPFGCGTLILALVVAGLWHFVVPGHVSPAGLRPPTQLVKLDGARPRPASVEVPVEASRGALSVAAFRP